MWSSRYAAAVSSSLFASSAVSRSTPKRAIGLARQREPLVSGRVDRLFGSGTVEPSAEPFAGALPRIGPGHALGAVFVAGQLLKLAQLGDGAAGIEHQRDRKRLPRVW